MQNKEHQILHPLVITINLLVIFLIGNIFGVHPVGLALENSGSTTTPPTAASGSAAAPAPVVVDGSKAAVDAVLPALCETELIKFGDPEFEKYMTFMEQNFLNKSRTADLLELGIKRYDKFKSDIWAKYEVLRTQAIESTAASGGGVAALLPGLGSCEAKASEYITNAGKMLQIRAVSSSNFKQASLFVEKYKQINDKLRVLNLDMMRMTNSITTFEQKLPCYLKTCL